MFLSATPLRRAARALVPVLAIAGLTAVSAPAQAAGGGLVINEVYGGGGNSGAVYTNDFVELYNPGDTAVSVDGMSLQYRSAASTSAPGSSNVNALNGTVPAHGSFLVQLAAGSTPAAPLPTPDDTVTASPINLSGTGGQVFLAQGTAPVVPQTDAAAPWSFDPAVVDFVGWGSAVVFEGSVQAPATTNATSIARPGHADTDDNAADFTAGVPTPTGSGGGGSTGGGCAETEPTIAEVQGTDTDTSPYAGCTVTVQGVVTADYPTGGLNGFTLQTAGTGGTADATPGASDAVFVYGSISAGQVSVGESVSVTAQVQEYAGETELSSPTVTQVTPALAPVTPARLAWSAIDTAAEREAHESELIALQGDYTVTDNYDINYYGTIVLAADSAKPLYAPTDVAAPGSAQAQATAAYDASHAITLDDGSSWNYSTTHTGDPLPWLTRDHSVTIGAAATFGSDGVVLDYRNGGWNLQPTHQVTDTGTDVATFTDLRHTANAAPQEVGGDIRLATFNMENYFVETGDRFVADGLGTCSFYKDRDGNEITDKTCTFADGSPGPRGAATTESLDRQLAKEVWGVNHLGAGIVSLEEVENSAKYGEDRDHALAVFVDALNAQAGAGTWAYVPTDGLPQPSIASQDVIRSAFIYQPALVTPVGAASILSDQSGTGQPFSIAREPLAQAFKGAGRPDGSAFLVVSNHFKSKGADASGLYDDCGAGRGDAENTDPAADQGGFNCTRVHEADAMSTWAEGLATNGGIAAIFMLGDFNAYTHEDPMETLYAKGYTDLQTAENGAGAKATYSYDGLEGSLDHVLANPAARATVTGADVWQIDGQEPVAYVYSRYNYNVTQLFDPTNAFGTSDHDPELVGIDLGPVPARVTAPDVVQKWGKPASVDVTVSAPGVTPTGTVTLSDGDRQLGRVTLGPDGTATIEIARRALAASPAAYRLTLTYSGDDAVAPATGTVEVIVRRGHGHG